MNSKFLILTPLIVALASCASQRKDPYDTGNLYGYPDAGYYGEQADSESSLYDTPPAYEDEESGPAYESADAGAGQTTHTVVRGDTLSGISRKYNVKMSAIIRANNIQNKNMLSIGEKLIIPGR